jgi:hypothetical protein
MGRPSAYRLIFFAFPGPSCPFDTHKKRLQRPVVHTDWERFTLHAARVRTFVYSDYLFHRDIFHALHAASDQPLLLPNLQNLTWLVITHDEDAPHTIRLHTIPPSPCPSCT